MADHSHPDDGPGHGTGPGGEIPGLPAEWAGLVIPDDARELDAVAEQIRRERRVAARRALVRRLTLNQRLERLGLSAPLVLLVLVVIGVFGTLVFLLPSAPAPPRAQPLADPQAAPGTVGGLLPEVRLTDSRGQPFALRDVRPAVLLVAAANCSCTPLLRDLAEDTSGNRLRVVVVTEGGGALTLADGLPRWRMRSVTDQDQVLGAAYAHGVRTPPPTALARPSGTPPKAAVSPATPAAAPTAVFVRANGVVSRVVDNPQPGPTLHTQIDALLTH
jgi:hypothetical protein